jgi:hypothetical protein
VGDDAPELPFHLEKFYGAVVLLDWMRLPGGENVQGIVGNVTFYSAKELTGHEVVTARNANWVLVVEGDVERHTILGCQVRSVITSPQSESADYYKVP